jgi:tetratricopeptide (TPR) repeat protein
MRYVFEVLGSGRPFELPAEFTLSPPFSAMQEAADSYRRLQKKAVRLVPSVFGQTSWSPDGKQLAYGRTDMYALQPDTLGTGAPAIYGSSGIEILDIESGATRLLVSSGKDPAWSPDGKYIAFVREPYHEELWIMQASGGESRRLAVGHWPIWARDSKRLFFHSYADWALYSVSIDDPAVKPERIIDCPSDFPWVSPDEKYVAYAIGRELRILEISSGQVVTKWIAPGPETGMLLRWSPDGKEIFIGGFHESDFGLWCFDVQRKDAWQIFDAPAIMGTLSPDRSQMTVVLRIPFGEIWLAKLDPNIPTYQALAPVLTRDEFLTHRYEQYLRVAKAGALEVMSHMYLGKFIQMLATLGTNQYREANYEDAIVSLGRADQLRLALTNKSDPCDIAHIAMSLHQLGRQQEAQDALNHLRLLFDDEEYINQISCLCEAEMLFAGKDSKVYLVWECLKTGKLQEALQLIDEIKSQPSQDTQIAACLKSAAKVLSKVYCNRAKAAESVDGGYSGTISDYQTATRIDPCCAHAFHSFAWFLATCPDPQFRNGLKAVEAATRACELTNWKNYEYLSTLAAAYSESGDFTPAIKWQKEAIDLLPQDKRAIWLRNYEARLKSYQSGNPYSKIFSTNKLVAHWKFDGDTKDSSGSELHGKLIGDAKIVSDPVRGKVLSLDGAGNYVNCGNNTLFNLADQITVSAWINIHSVPANWTAIISKGDSAWRLSTDQRKRSFQFAVTGAPFYLCVNGNTVVSAGQWHYVCGTFDGSVIRLYVDGVEDANVPYRGSLTTNKFPVYIGDNAEQTGRFWDGLIDDVRIYNYALSKAEVKNLYIGREPDKK